MKLYVDASSSGFGAVLFSEDRIVAMFSRSNPRPYQHSSTSEIEGLIKALREMKSLLMGKKFMIYTDNWSVLRAMRGQTQKDAVVRRLED